AARPAYLAGCSPCPGHPRVSGALDPVYAGVFVFDHDHPSVGMNAPTPPGNLPSIYQNRPAQGIARVVCYSPRHDLSLAQLEIVEIENLISAWQGEFVDLGNRAEIDHVLIFENKGEVVGVSNTHPHCQIYATHFLLRTIETEAKASTHYSSGT